MNFLNYRKPAPSRRCWWPPILLLPWLLLSACSGLTESTQSVAAPNTGLPEPRATSERRGGSATHLSAELLYQLLLANIAAQRAHGQVAMESMTRAARLSQHRKVVAWAMQLAEQQQDHQRVIALSHLLERLAPDHFRNQLARAEAQFRNQQPAQALQTLMTLARAQRAAAETTAPILQMIAELLAQQSPPPLSQLRAAMQTVPNNPQLTLTAALLAYELKQHAEFIAWLEQALQLRRGWETAARLKLTHLANFAPRADADFQPELNLQRMSVFADRFLQEFPDAERFRLHYARLLLQKEQSKKALTHSEAVLRRDPHSSAALFASGMAYLQQEKLPKARARLERLLALAPHHDQTRLHLADLEIKQQNWAAASAMLSQVAAQNYYLDAQIKLASVRASQHGVESGIRHLAQIDILNEREAIRMILAQASLYLDFNLLGRAKAVLDEGLRRKPGYPALLYQRGLLAAQLNLLVLHERDMCAVIAQQPEHAHAYNALGYTLADQTERLAEALALITKALAMQPHDPFILDSMGWVNFRIGKHDQAIKYLRRALALKKDAEIAAHLGEVLWHRGQPRAARKIWRQGKRWSPHNATLLATMKRFSRSASARAAVAKSPAVTQLRWDAAAPAKRLPCAN